MANEKLRAAIRKYSDTPGSDLEAAGEENEVQPDRGGNTRLPFGLCQRYGISLPRNATPRDAWDALKGKTGLSPQDFYDSLKRGEELPANDDTADGSKKQEEGKETSADGLNPFTIANVAAGKPMSFDQANQGRANPHFNTSKEYGENCQSCVVCYEARLRGYDVEALPYGSNTQMRELARNTSLAWIDPTTNEPPKYITAPNANTPKRLKAFLETKIEKGARYTLQFHWKGRGNSAHIISVDRQDDGSLRLYDPQSGQVYTGGMVNRLLNEIKFSTSIYGLKINLPPKVLRVDNMKFNPDYVDKIMKRSGT